MLACCQMDVGVQFYFYSREGVQHTKTMYVRNRDGGGGGVDEIARGVVALEVLEREKLGYELFRTRTRSTWFQYLPTPDAGLGRWWVVVDEEQKRQADQIRVVQDARTKMWLVAPKLFQDANRRWKLARDDISGGVAQQGRIAPPKTEHLVGPRIAPLRLSARTDSRC